MKIHIEKNVSVPAGFYCEGCQYRERDNVQPLESPFSHYCREFYGFLDKEKTGKNVKQSNCLLACRESLMEG